MKSLKLGNPVGRAEFHETYNKSGPKNVTSTTNTEPPEYLVPGLKLAADAATSQFRSGGVNPFTSLDMQFNRASDLTRGRLDTEFAGAGRNLGASYPARSDELQTLAANIYDPANMMNYDPLNQYIDRLAAITPGAGGRTTATQPVFRTGLFG